MRLLRSELWLQRVSLVVWFVSVIALVALVVAFYPQIRNDTSLDSLYANLSPSMQALLGGSDLTSPVGYLNTQLFAFFLPTVLLVFGLGRGAGSIAGEEEEHKLDLLLAQPVSRRSAYLQKSAAVATGLAALTVGSWLVLWVSNSPVQFDLPFAGLAAVSFQMGLFCLALSLVAQAIAAATGRRAYGISGVAGYTIVSYVLYGLSSTVSWLRTVRPLTLWRWYLLDDPLRSGFTWSGVAVLVAVGLVSLFIGLQLFGRRDLRA
jgi:ABC-2 type transport system permease protein